MTFWRRRWWEYETSMGGNALALDEAIEAHKDLGVLGVEVKNNLDYRMTKLGKGSVTTVSKVPGKAKRNEVTSLKGFRKSGMTGDFVLKHRDKMVKENKILMAKYNTADSYKDYPNYADFKPVDFDKIFTMMVDDVISSYKSSYNEWPFPAHPCMNAPIRVSKFPGENSPVVTEWFRERWHPAWIIHMDNPGFVCYGDRNSEVYDLCAAGDTEKAVYLYLFRLIKKCNFANIRYFRRIPPRKVIKEAGSDWRPIIMATEDGRVWRNDIWKRKGEDRGFGKVSLVDSTTQNISYFHIVRRESGEIESVNFREVPQETFMKRYVLHQRQEQCLIETGWK